ncbi:MAG: hypothetical protein PHV74_16040 [Dehalococcoidia bacterium]|nr:hypothetical protein [Dehalococcoidia bacterium]
MNDEDRKLLTEYLGECWHEWTGGVAVKTSSITTIMCQKCGKIKWHDLPRTFTTRSDMMGLYQAIAKKGKWGEFFHHAKDPFELVALCPDESGTGYDCYESDFTTWLFCLSGEGYDERCQMVAEWVKEAIHESK